MIINVFGSNPPYSFNRILLNPQKTFLIRFISIHGILSSGSDSSIYKLCTNLIEREEGNSERVITYLRLEKRENVIDYVPQLSLWYKLRLHDLNSAEFNLESILSNKKLSFKEFSCQFEINENARLQ